MNNDDLLILAKAANFHQPSLKVVSPIADFVVLGYSGYKNIVDCEIFKPEENNGQFVIVFDWVTKIGYFEHLTNDGAGYRLNQDEKMRFCSGYKGTKANIINIAVQAAKYLEGLR